MAREPKNYDHLIGKVKGLSENQLKTHFTLYQGYVKKLNEIEQKLGTVDKSAPNYCYNEYSELKRREPVAYNGTFLHEVYFDNLGGERDAARRRRSRSVVDAHFGSWDNYIADIKAAAGSAPRLGAHLLRLRRQQASQRTGAERAPRGPVRRHAHHRGDRRAGSTPTSWTTGPRSPTTSRRCWRR